MFITYLLLHDNRVRNFTLVNYSSSEYFSIYIDITLMVIYISTYTVFLYTFFFIIRILGNTLRCSNFYVLYHV